MFARTSTALVKTDSMPADKSTGPITAKIPFACCLVLLSMFVAMSGDAAAADKPVSHLAGTSVMSEMKDPAAEMVAGIDRFLLNRLEALREQRYQQAVLGVGGALGSADGYRQRLAWILGVRDDRVPFEAPELLATADHGAVLARNDDLEVLAVRWPVVADIWAEGLLIRPTSAKKPVADVIVIPDADQRPEQLAGLVDGFPEDLQAARKLAEQGCRVLVPALVSRAMENRSPAEGTRAVTISNREFVYRTSFVLGRHLIGYEVQTVLAAVDWMSQDETVSNDYIGVYGVGEGGMLALYSSALDERIKAAVVSGYVDHREKIWQQPIDRNVFGLLDHFGDAELLAAIAPRPVIVEAGPAPSVTLPGDHGGAPAVLEPPAEEDVKAEVERANAIAKAIGKKPSVTLESAGGNVTAAFIKRLGAKSSANATLAALRRTGTPLPDAKAREERSIHQMVDNNQELLAASAHVRRQYMKGLDFSSPEAYEKSSAKYREKFHNDVIGRIDIELLPANPRTRLKYDEPTWTGYEVQLDVFPDVFAYGVLLLPKDLKPGDRRPVVVCQHGLEGTPEDCIVGDHRAYHDFARVLCERGFVVFAPQNPYRGFDKFRTLQRKLNPQGETLFSAIVPQHQQIVDWLQTQPYVDPDRIGFYGLSYGGKAAMRVPALVTDYALSICSGDFNEWVWKNTSTRFTSSYVFTPEYEIFEFDLGSTFNYAEMAALIAPRPFMVERGFFDGVGTDSSTAYEYAKVRRLYVVDLKHPERTEIEWFVGPHTINGVGSYRFLHKHLGWPEPKAAKADSADE